MTNEAVPKSPIANSALISYISKARMRYIFLAALFIRLLFVFVITPYFIKEHDASSFGGYDLLAKQFIENGSFVFRDGTINVQRPPVYILFLAVHYMVFGDTNIPVFFTQSLLGAISVCLVWILARRLGFSHYTAVFSSIIYAIYPFAVFRTNKLLADVLFVPMFLLIIILTISPCKQNKLPASINAALLGIICALLTMIKPIVVLLPLVIVLRYMTAKRNKMLLNFCMALVFFAFYFLLLSPWLLRNHGITGEFPVFSSGTGFNFLHGTVYAEQFSWRNMASHDLDMQTNNRLDSIADMNGWTVLRNPEVLVFKEDKALTSLQLDLQRKHPAEAAFRYLKNLSFFWFLATSHKKSMAYLFLQVPILLMAIFCILKNLSNYRRDILLIVSAGGYLWALNSFILGQVRYSDALMPIIIIFASQQFIVSINSLKKKLA